MRTSHYEIGFAVAGMLMLGVGWANEMSGSGTTMKQESGMKRAQSSLYERLGTKEITAVVDDFVGRVANDGRINGKFANANIS